MPVIVPVLSNVESSINITVPVAPTGTVAVNVTDCPKIDGLLLEETITAAIPAIPGVAFITTYGSTGEVLESRYVVGLPPYCTVRLFVPTEREVRFSVATLLIRVPVPKRICSGVERYGLAIC